MTKQAQLTYEIDSLFLDLHQLAIDSQEAKAIRQAIAVLLIERAQLSIGEEDKYEPLG